MTTMLVKMISAMFAADDGEPDDGPNYSAMARDALLAIREPDEAVTSAMGDGPFPPWSDLNYNFTDEERLIVWKSGLDAILNEKPGDTDD